MFPGNTRVYPAALMLLALTAYAGIGHEYGYFTLDPVSPGDLGAVGAVHWERHIYPPPDTPPDTAISGYDAIMLLDYGGNWVDIVTEPPDEGNETRTFLVPEYIGDGSIIRISFSTDKYSHLFEAPVVNNRVIINMIKRGKGASYNPDGTWIGYPVPRLRYNADAEQWQRVLHCDFGDMDDCDNEWLYDQGNDMGPDEYWRYDDYHLVTPLIGCPSFGHSDYNPAIPDISDTARYPDEHFSATVLEPVWPLERSPAGFLHLAVEGDNLGYYPYGELNLVFSHPDDSAIVLWDEIELAFSADIPDAFDGADIASYPGGIGNPSGYISADGLQACLLPYGTLRSHASPPPVYELYERYMPTGNVHYYSGVNKYRYDEGATAPSLPGDFDYKCRDSAINHSTSIYGSHILIGDTGHFRVPPPDALPFRIWFQATNNPKDIMDNLNPGSNAYNTRWIGLLDPNAPDAGISTGSVSGSPGAIVAADTYSEGVILKNIADFRLLGRYLAIKIILYTNTNTATVFNPGAGNDYPNPAANGSCPDYPYFFGNHLWGEKLDWDVDLGWGAEEGYPIDAVPGFFEYNDRTMTPQLRSIRLRYHNLDLNVHLGSFRRHLGFGSDGTPYDRWRVRGSSGRDYHVIHR